MSWTIPKLDLATVNAAFNRFGAFLSKLSRDGSLADAALSANIPRHDAEALTRFDATLTASVGTISSPTYSARYAIRGDVAKGTDVVMRMDCYFTACTLNNTPAWLAVGIPAGWLVSDSTQPGLYGTAVPFSDNGTPGTGLVLANAATSQATVRIFKNISGTGTFAVSAALTVFAFQIEFRVRRP